ncbi:MAG TPA: NAD-dependent epimerase/dehydratase family protein [Pyrinomonadaceae bacterium]|nr:NAD-dependent epimerase/dehydratase family protein [Pyrinomonadaceae bacterium]
MKLLIIGGTRFFGRHLVTAALERDHEITLFNRGTHSSETNVETIQGDRHIDIAKLRGRRWDAAIDTYGMLPSAVRSAAAVLADSVDRYIFISSQNAYADVSTPGVTETAPLATLTSTQLDEAYAIDRSGEPSYGKLYGGLKALCEQTAEEVMPNRVLIIRPGLIVGPHDYTDRFTYWVARIARGGEVLAPGRPDRYVQFIDVRDLAEWTVHMIERKETGVYYANSVPKTFTMKDVLDECRAVSRSDASFTWASEEFLLQNEVVPWSEMPLWLPEEAAPHLKGFMFVNSDKAVRAGLNFRSLTDTIGATLNWYQTDRRKLKAGLEPDKEEALLRKLRETRSNDLETSK